MPTERLDGGILDQLYAVIQKRSQADPDSSRTAKLFRKGLPKIAQKVGEEAVETVIDAVSGEEERVIEESADLLYHLLVLWAVRGIEPEQVWRALEARQGVAWRTGGGAGGTPS